MKEIYIAEHKNSQEHFSLTGNVTYTASRTWTSQTYFAAIKTIHVEGHRLKLAKGIKVKMCCLGNLFLGRHAASSYFALSTYNAIKETLHLGSRLNLLSLKQ